jgi:transitional endoplasmic reticulum ATPase
MAAQDQTYSVFSTWQSYTSSPIQDPELKAQEILHGLYPSHHVTRTTKSCDLVGFAEAGHAKMTPRLEEGVNAIRLYSGPRSGSRTAEGRLHDGVRFGCWDFTWNDHTFLVYQMNFKDLYMREHPIICVLAPLSHGEVVEGHHSLTDAMLLACGAWTSELHDEIYVFDDGSWSKSKLLFASVQGAGWDDVILDPGMKKNLIHDVKGFFDNRDLYHRMQVPWKRGIILHGVPGNGKTVSLKALINSLAARDIPSLYVKSLDGCNGPKWAISEIFALARRSAPCLLIFEDLDSTVTDKTRSYFLNEVDGLESNDGILMIGSTNHLDRLDVAITKRPSRFDRKYHFKVPEKAERIAYAQYWSRKFADAEDVGFEDAVCEVIAGLTAGWSFAYMKELFISALLTLARGGPGEEDEEEEEKTEESDKAASDGGSSSDTVLVDAPAEKGEAAEEANDEGTKNETEASATDKDADKAETNETQAEKPKPKPKRVLPQVHIPESLRDSTLVKVFKKEAKTLWEQMDNTEEQEAIDAKVKMMSGPGMPKPMRIMRARPAGAIMFSQ